MQFGYGPMRNELHIGLSDTVYRGYHQLASGERHGQVKSTKLH